MKATLRQTRGTVWGNNIEIELSTELDIPHKLSTADLALSMILTMHTFLQALRDEDDRAIEAGQTLTHEMRADRPPPGDGARQDRERERLTEMRDAQERGRT